METEEGGICAFETRDSKNWFKAISHTGKYLSQVNKVHFYGLNFYSYIYLQLHRTQLIYFNNRRRFDMNIPSSMFHRVTTWEISISSILFLFHSILLFHFYFFSSISVNDCLLGRCSMQTGRNWPTFQRCLLPPQSGLTHRIEVIKIKP
jgi:hypothetical protein